MSEDGDDAPRTGKVLRLPDVPRVTGPRPPITRATPKPGSWCAHRQTELDYRARSLTCRECKREVDPYQFLNSLMCASDYEDAVRTKIQLGKEIDALAKERQRLRDSVNRLKRKQQ